MELVASIDMALLTCSMFQGGQGSGMGGQIKIPDMHPQVSCEYGHLGRCFFTMVEPEQ